ncbi:MAG: sensor histidine kinase [Myxococcota bacterium]
MVGLGVAIILQLAVGHECRAWGPGHAPCCQDTPAQFYLSQARPTVLRVGTEDLAEGRFVTLPLEWLAQRGDDPRWATPEFDDGDWTARPTRLYAEDLEAGAAVLWFRLHLELDEALIGQPLALAIPRTGAAEVFIDGAPVPGAQLGRPAGTVLQDGHGQPFSISFTGGGAHLLAVRWSAEEVLTGRLISYTPAFRAMLGRSDDLHAYAVDFRANTLAWAVAAAAFPLALALLHVCLWFFRRRRRGDLLFAAFATSVGAISMIPMTLELVWTWSGLHGAWTVFRVSLAILTSATLLFHLHLWGEAKERRKWRLAVLGSGLLMAVAAPALSNEVLFIYSMAALALAMVVLVLALKRVPARIHLGGMIPFSVGCMVSMLGALDILQLSATMYNAHVFGVPFLLMGMALALAWEFGESLRLQETHAAESRARAEVLAELEKAYDELRKAQAELVETSRVATMVKLVAGLTHEMNTPLGALQSSLDLLDRCRERLVSGEITPDRAARVHDEASANGRKAAARLSGLVEKLGRFVHLDEAETQEVDLTEGLETTLDLLDTRRAGEVEVKRRIDRLPPIRCQPVALNRAVAELLDNAVDAIAARGGGGRIQLEAEVVEDQIRIAVTDDGVGLSEEQKGGLFEVGFKKGERVAMGFGLLSARKAVRAHGGHIHVDSQLGAGARFELTLPLVHPGPSLAEDLLSGPR